MTEIGTSKLEIDRIEGHVHIWHKSGSSEGLAMHFGNVGFNGTPCTCLCRPCRGRRENWLRLSSLVLKLIVDCDIDFQSGDPEQKAKQAEEK